MQLFRRRFLLPVPRAPTDFLQLRANMALSARGASGFMAFRKAAARALGGCRPAWLATATVAVAVAARAAWVSLSAVPLSKVEELSHDALVRRASSLVTDSAATFLSQTTLALAEALTQYTRAVHTLIALQKRYLASLGKLAAEEEDAVWQVIIGQRVEVGDKLEECKRFESSWRTAVSLCELAAEAAHKAGASEASATVQTKLRVAQSHVEQIRQLSLMAERKLVETKAEEIQRIAEFAASMEKGAEDIPEAYLRED